MKSVHTNTQAVGSIPPKGGGAYASYLSHKEVDCHDHRAEDFQKGKVTKRKKSNRHSPKVTVVLWPCHNNKTVMRS